LHNQYLFDHLWVQGTGWRFIKSDEPKQPQKYKEEPAYKRWLDVRYPNLDSKPTQRVATNEELNEILYGDKDFDAFW